MSFKSLESVDHSLSSFIPPPLSFNFSRYQDIIHSIHLARKPNLGLKSCDGNQELLNFLRSDLIEVATRLQKGGLGYVEETSEFEARVRPSGKYPLKSVNLELFPDTLLDFPRWPQGSYVWAYFERHVEP